MSHEFVINVDDQAEDLRKFKKDQADLLDQQIGSLEIELWAVETFDVLSKTDQIIEENRVRGNNVIKKMEPFVERIKKGGHLSKKVEGLYLSYLKCKMMAHAHQMLTETKIRGDKIAETIDKMVKLDLCKTNTFVRLKEIIDELTVWKKNIQQMFNPRQKTERTMLEELKRIKSCSLNPIKDTIKKSHSYSVLDLISPE